MKKNESVQKIMTPNPETVQIGQKLSEVRATFRKLGFRHIPVMDKDTLVGVLSETDLIRLVYDDKNTDNRLQDAIIDQQFTISEIMSKDLQTLPISSSVKDVAEILSHSSYHSVLIVDAGKLAGIITSTDLIRYLFEQY